MKTMIVLAGILSLVLFGSTITIQGKISNDHWTAEHPNPPAEIDPRLMDELPANLDQGSPDLYDGLRLVTPAHYTLTVTQAADGSLYWPEYWNMNLMKLSPSGMLEKILGPRGGMYSIAMDSFGNLVLGLDSDTNQGSVIIRDFDTTETPILSNINRPRQIVTAHDGRIYIVLEGGQIQVWDPQTGQVSILIQNLLTPQGVAVGNDNSLFYSCYGKFGNGGVALEPGYVEVKRSFGQTTRLVNEYYRTRGIALNRTSGDLYILIEANAWDQGNSGMLVRRTGLGSVEVLCSGLDYPQFPYVGQGGKVYFPLARDGMLAMYDPTMKTTLTTWPGANEVQVRVENAILKPNQETGSELVVSATDRTYKAKIEIINQQQLTSLWISIPANRFNISREELPYIAPDRQAPGPGWFPVPEITVTVGGQPLKSFTIPIRQHYRCRWPMNNNIGELPAPDFMETPYEYWIYTEYPPQ